jgi:lipid II isoglutaminyl synthase (glutamine-hydrolysing)
VTPLVRIAVIYPDLLGTYGDGGNGLILARRAEWYGAQVVLTQAPSDAALPEADIYCLGGGEDGPQVRAARSLIEDATLARRAAEGAVVLAVCAGYQIVGKTFPGADGTVHEGVGLLDITTTKGTGPRAVGEVVGEPTDGAPGALPTLTGFENHGGRTALGDGVTALALVTHGVGNGDGSATEGAVAGRVVGTYLHGPVLARNPALADLLLRWALGIDVAVLSGMGARGAADVSFLGQSDSAARALREERLAATGGGDRRILRRRRRRRSGATG